MYYKIPKLQARMYIWAAVTTASLPHNEDMCNMWRVFVFVFAR